MYTIRYTKTSDGCSFISKGLLDDVESEKEHAVTMIALCKEDFTFTILKCNFEEISL